MGRPSKYNDSRMSTIVTALRNGSTRTAAAEAAGVHRDTFYEWLGKNPDFSDAVTRAEAACEGEMAKALKTAAKDDWRAAEAWLKRRRKAEWSEKIEQEHSGNLNVNAILNALPAEFREQVRSELDRMVRGGSGVAANGNGRH